jgi:hypothetical protein
MAARELLNAKATTGNRKRLVNGIVDSNPNSEDGPDAPRHSIFPLPSSVSAFPAHSVQLNQDSQRIAARPKNEQPGKLA